MKDILEELKKQVGCDYISDLKCCKRDVLSKFMIMIESDQFTLKDYHEVISYIYDKNLEFETIDELKEIVENKMAE